MIFNETELKGAYIIDIQPIRDNRGYFSRAMCKREFDQFGLMSCFVQANLTYSPRRGTLRGFHYQVAPFEEVKLVRCTRGAIYDVIIDLRPDSPTFEQWRATELSADNHKTIYIPAGFAHGYQALLDDTEVYYQVGEFYTPEYDRGIRWNDATFAVQWPITPPPILSEKDQHWPDYVREAAHAVRSAV